MAVRGISGVALITGAGGGLGTASAISFAEAGAVGIVLADIDIEAAERSASEARKHATHPQYRSIAVTVDVASPESVQNMVDRAIQEFGRIDYSVNSAGVGSESSRPISETNVEEYDKLMSINARGTMLCMAVVSKAMSRQEPVMFQGRVRERSLGRGSIVNLGSANSFLALPGRVSYGTSKAAVIGMTRAAAVDNLSLGIRVNAVYPAYTDTPLLSRAIAEDPKIGERVKELVGSGRLAEAEEVAEAIVFLCSPSASYINGVGLMMDNGMFLSVHQ